jgi:hypothetical protein
MSYVLGSKIKYQYLFENLENRGAKFSKPAGFLREISA